MDIVLFQMKSIFPNNSTQLKIVNISINTAISINTDVVFGFMKSVYLSLRGIQYIEWCILFE
jgi:hypothetical protein